MLNKMRVGLLSMFLFMCAIPAHAITLYSEDWEGTPASIESRWGSGSYGGFPNEPGNFGSVAEQPFFLDTSIKFSGSHSLRLNFTGSQYDIPPHGGGFASLFFPRSTEIWITFYSYMAPGFQVAGAGGVGGVVTKGIYSFMRSATRCVLNNDANPVPCGTPGSQLQENGWVFQYFNGSREMQMSAQGIKDARNSEGTLKPYNTENFEHNIQVFQQPFGHWIGYEAHIRLNTPGQANGLYELYATDITAGTPTILCARWLNREFLDSTPTGMMPSDAAWDKTRMYRQDGFGQMYYDKISYTTTRIGVSGTAPPADTQAPTTPSGLVVR